MFDPKTKFLVVDDFMIMRNLVKKILVEKGYTNLVTAQNGDEALKMLKEAHDKNEPFQFVVSDWNMPVMSGLELLKACRADAQFKNIPFIMVTAESEQSQIIEAVKCGVSEYIVKPFNAITFNQKLEKVFNKYNPTTKAA